MPGVDSRPGSSHDPAHCVNTPNLKPVDAHVHIVGTGAGGTGCWLDSSSFLRRLQARFLLKAIGMEPQALREDFDRLYVEHLLTKLRESSLGAAVILAQEQVYDAQGKLIESITKALTWGTPFPT